VWVRGRRKNTRARSLASLGFGRVNGPPKSGPILAGTRLPFADLFCHFESVTDFTRGILGLVTNSVFGTPKTLAVGAEGKLTYGRRTTHLNLPAAPPRTLLHPVCRRAPAIERAGLRNLVLSDPAPGESE
jgi:hypothetical protein